MKVNTINVTEMADDAILGITSFSTDEEGKAEAEERFRFCVKENGENVTDEEIEDCIEDGYFEQGNYQVFITWSDGS